MSFAHLHVHTTYSILDGISRREDIVKKAVELGMPAVAVTEHGNVHNVLSFYKTARDAGIKPIIGMEAYVAADSRFNRDYKSAHGAKESDDDLADFTRYAYHLTILAKDRVGLRNLFKLSTIAYREGFYRRPRIDFEVLAEYNEGLIVLSGCLGSYTSQLIISGQQEKALQVIDRLRAIFGERFFLEVMSHDIPEERVVGKALVEFGNKRGIGLVLTGDSHFTEESHANAHEVALCVGTRRQITDPRRFRFEGSGYWFKSPQEMWESCYKAGYPQEAFTNSLVIANMVDDYDLKLVGDKDSGASHQVPLFRDQQGRTWSAEDCHFKLRMRCLEGLQQRIEENPAIADDPRYMQRLEYELDVMRRKNFSSYFLIIADIVDYMWKTLKILKPVGRGSSVGSLVCYVLGITSRDPIARDIPFYRFINEGRKDLPDVDTDISQHKRQEVLNFIADTYGRDRVALICTFNEMGPKSVIDKVGSALGVPVAIRRQISKMLGELAPDARFDETIAENPKVAELLKITSNWAEYCSILDKNNSNTSSHAAGIIISNEPLDEVVPLLRDSDGFRLTQFDMSDLSKLGLLKLDMLGLKTLDLIQSTFDQIAALRPGWTHDTPGHLRDENGNMVLNFYNMPLDDAPTYRMISGGEYVSVFQYDSHGMRAMAKKLQPEVFEHLLALNALFRPGPLKRQPIYNEKGEQVGEEPSIADRFIARRHGREPEDVWHPSLRPAFARTHGMPIFQEQISEMAKIIAGFNDQEADEYRSAIGKKNKEAFDAAQAKFIERGIANGHSREFMEDLTQKLLGFARYAWNIGHSDGYSYVSYVAAYLECHYPIEYYTSLLNMPQSDADKFTALLSAILQKGVKIIPPDINRSGPDFTTDGKTIWMGLRGIRGIGAAAMVPILYERERNGEYQSFLDFCRRMNVVYSIPASHPLAQRFILPDWDYEKNGAPPDDIPIRAPNKTVKTNLVKIGAFSWDRQMPDYCKVSLVDDIQKLARKHLKSPMGDVAILAELGDKVVPQEYTDKERMSFERELLGFFISGHPVHMYARMFQYIASSQYVITSPSSMNDVDIGCSAMMVANVVKKDMATTKRNKPYIKLTIGDQFTNVLVMIWSPLAENMWDRLRQDQMVLLVGKIMEDKIRPGEVQFAVDAVIPLDAGFPIGGAFGPTRDEAVRAIEALGHQAAHVSETPGYGVIAQPASVIYVQPDAFDCMRRFALSTSGNTKYFLSV